MNGTVWAVTVYDGDLVAGGLFSTAGGQTVNNIARWDGSAWHPFTSGGEIGMNNDFGTAPVESLTVYNGNLVAGGVFNTAGGQTVNHIALWNGSAWHPFITNGSTGMTQRVLSLTVHNGHLVAGGVFTLAGGEFVSRIARWDGSEWHPFVSDEEIGVNHNVRALRVHDGDLVVGGNFAVTGNPTEDHTVVNRIVRWNGAWQPFVSGKEVGVNNVVHSLMVYNGDLVVGGAFSMAGDLEISRIARWGCDEEPSIPGDLNGDGVVDVSDLLILLSQWGTCADPGDCPADINGDGEVDVSDLLILLANWG